MIQTDNPWIDLIRHVSLALDPAPLRFKASPSPIPSPAAVSVVTTRHYPQIRVIMLDGVTYGGFNVVDITELQRRTGLPVIVVMRAEPDMARIRDAMQNLPDADRRWQSILNAGAIRRSMCMRVRCIFSAQESRLRMQGRSCNSQRPTATSLSRSV
jgi:hypothetical protein